MGKNIVSEYDANLGGPELRKRVSQARKEISAIVRDLNIWLCERDLEMTFKTSVHETRLENHPSSATLKAHLRCGLVPEAKMADHLAQIAEAEAREARHKQRLNRRTE
ncbi:MAG: hypothetical protein AB9869_33210 [Verrucomicrobiia bacterium]